MQVYAAATEVLAAAVEAELRAGSGWDAIAARLGITARRAKQMFAVQHDATRTRRVPAAGDSTDVELGGDPVGSVPDAEHEVAPDLDPVGWRSAVPEAVADAVQALVDAVESEPIASPASSILGADLRRWLHRLVAAVTSDNGAGLRRALRWLLATPMNPGDLQDTPVFTAVRVLAKASRVLLQCPTCNYRPGPEPAERSRHLEYVDMLWLDMVDEQIVPRRHCMRCEPTGIVGVSLSCPTCEEGFLLERALAAENAQGRLPAPLRDFLARAGWQTAVPPAGGPATAAHRACLATMAGPVHRAPFSSVDAHSA